MKRFFIPSLDASLLGSCAKEKILSPNLSLLCIEESRANFYPPQRVTYARIQKQTNQKIQYKE